MNVKSIKILLRLLTLFFVCCVLLSCTYKPSREAFILPQPVDSIALLLPLTGIYGESGQAVRNGFLAAYYTDKQADITLPTVNVIDTARGNIASLYQRATRQGATFIIGPLLNPNLKKLSNFEVPTISLNWLPGDRSYRNLYQFGLSAIDEVTQIVQQMDRNGYKNVLIIVPKNAWGIHLEQVFVNQWKALDKNVIGTLEFTTAKKLNQDISALLNVNQSYGNAWQLRQVTHEKVRFLPRRRQDFDAIFLAATPSMARQIVPLLRFYYVQSTPIYATASIYVGKTSSSRDQDINGIIFCDMPWMLLSKNQLPDILSPIDGQIARLWPKNAERYPRFYALGIDAYLIFKNFNTLGISAQQTVQGATGLLYLTDDQHIRRLLTFVQIIDGQPKLINLNR